MKRFVMPAKGLVVRMPERDFKAMPATGVNVEMSAYWLRRQACGDIVYSEKPRPLAQNEHPGQKPGHKKDKSN